MVIHHFNRLIKNKWVWGVFAVAISFFFAFDFLLTGDGSGDGRAPAGTLGGEDVSAADFDAYAGDARGRGRRSSDLSNAAVHRQAWEALASARVAEALGLVATDDDVRDAILRERAFADKSGKFNQMAYQYILRENGMTPEMFEAAEKRRITLAKLRMVVGASGAFVAPSELAQAVNDVTDKFTVRVASFKDDAWEKVKLDDAGLKKYYDDNTNSIALPDCVSVKYAAFPADGEAYLKNFTVAEDEIHDRYDSDLKRWETTTTNGTVTTPFEQLKDQLERELKLIAALDAMKTNVLFRAYPADAVAATNGASRLEKIAAEEKRPVLTSPLFALDGGRYVEGFMSRPSKFLPGVEGFLEAVAEIDPDSEDLRYGIAMGTNAVYLIEIAKRVPAHVPTFEEAKAQKSFNRDALHDAQLKSFKDSVDKQRALAAAALAKGEKFDAKLFAGANVTTSLTFSVMSHDANFADSRYVTSAAMKLAAGQISEFVTTSSDRRGVLVYVEKREAGDAAQAQMIRERLRGELSSLPGSVLGSEWAKWNLARLGVQATETTSMEEHVDDGDVSED